MAFVIVNTTNPTVEKLLTAWVNPRGSRRARDRITAKKYFIRQLGPGTYLMEPNAGGLALLYDLKLRYKGDVYIYVVKPLSVRSEFPEEIVKVVEECRKTGRNLLEKDLKPLEKIQILCSVNWKRSS